MDPIDGALLRASTPTAALECASLAEPFLAPGTRLGPYEVRSVLGEGGMGVVYRAHDTRLHRDVAVKVLRPLSASDPDRLARFDREARILASLNHPNVATIFGIEYAAGAPAIAMELLDGETVAHRIAGANGPGRGLPVAETLGIARQIAEALDAAHERGIVHRDLKPANVLVTRDGLVKVLDFGLARTAAPDADADLTSLSTIPARTSPGTIMGTVAYMSPEQARGLAVDRRTDIWAFGCILYEMLSGQPAFGRETTSDTLAAILDRAPDLTRLPEDTPALVKRVIERCLQKDLKRRARDIADVAADLQTPADPAPPHSTSRRRSAAVPVTVTSAVLALAAASFVFWQGLRPGVEPPGFSRIIRLTQGTPREFGPAISPDGKWVAYLSDARGPVDVWVRFVTGGEPVNLTANTTLEVATTSGISGLEVSPDGTRIAVMAKTRGSTGPFSTWEIPAPLPGVPRKVLDEGFLGMRWSADGTHITYIRAGPSEGDALWTADADGTNPHEIVRAGGGLHIHWPAWGADGFIYFNRLTTYVGNIDRSEIFRVRPDGSGMEAVVPTPRRAMFPLPLADGGIVYSSNPSTADLGLWWRHPSVSEPVRLTFGIGEYAEPRVSADGRVLVATAYDLRQSIARVELETGAQVTPLTDGFGGDLDPAIVPGSQRMVFSSARAGNRNLWVGNVDGTELRPLTSGPWLDERPAVSPNGRLVAFTSDRSGRPAVWVVSADGGSPRKVSDLVPIGQLSWKRDSSALVFAAAAGQFTGIWVASLSDGSVQRLPTTGAAADPAWSPTSDVVAYLEPASTGPANVRLAFVSATGERLHASLPGAPAISAGFANGLVAWSPDGKQVAIVSQNTNLPSALWTITPDEPGAAFRRVIQLPLGPRIRGITWLSDSTSLLIGMHDWTSDIVLMDTPAR